MIIIVNMVHSSVTEVEVIESKKIRKQIVIKVIQIVFKVMEHMPYEKLEEINILKDDKAVGVVYY